MVTFFGKKLLNYHNQTITPFLRGKNDWGYPWVEHIYTEPADLSPMINSSGPGRYMRSVGNAGVFAGFWPSWNARGRS